MAIPIKDGRSWRHRVMVNGKRTSGTFATKAAALAWESTLHESKELAGGQNTCEDAFKQYERDVSRHKRGRKWEELRLASFCASKLGSVKMRDLDATHIAAWRDWRLESVQGATVTREMNLLSHVFSVARKEWKWIDKSPTADVARPKAAPARDRRITQDEIDRICAALGHADAPPTTKQQRIALAFLFAIETAMRAGEICYLSALDVAGRVARLPAKICKNGIARDVALSPRAIEIWALAPDGFGLTSAALDALFRKARDRAGVKGLTFHDTRHEAITRLAKKIGVLDLARMVGHTDIKQLMTYYNESAHDIAGKL